MPSQVESACEALITSAAHGGPLAGVQPRVSVQVAIFMEHLFASTNVGHFRSTHFPMSGLVAALFTVEEGIQLPHELDILAVSGNIPCVVRILGAEADVRTSPSRHVSTTS